MSKTLVETLVGRLERLALELDAEACGSEGDAAAYLYECRDDASERAVRLRDWSEARYG